MNFLHFIVYAHRNKLLKVKSWLLSSHFFSNVIDDVSSRQVARAQPTQPPPSQSHSNVDVSFLILPLTNITSIPSDQLLYVSFTQKVPEAEIGTVRFSLEWTTGIHFFISFLRLDGFSSGRIMWSDFRHHKV